MSAGRISRVRLRRVKIPLRFVYVSSMYVMPATYRTVIEVETTDGLVGLGETLGTEDVFRLTTQLAGRWLGTDPLDRRARQFAFARSVFDNRNGRNGWSAFAGLEMASWDLAARRLDLPLAALWGGAVRSAIPVVSPLPALVLSDAVDRHSIAARFGELDNVEPVIQFAVRLARDSGFSHFKYKSAGSDPGWDLRVMTRLRESLAPETRLRFDPNAAYPVAQAIALCRELDPLGLEFYEDPTDDLEGLAGLRGQVRGKVATNMFVVQVDHLPAAIRRGAVDVVLADVFMWGGIDRFRAMVPVATSFDLEVGIHSLFETGIGTALNLHLAASTPEITRANDTGLHYLARDVIAGDGFSIAAGAMVVPSGPGLGVDLDQAAMEELSIEEQVVRA